MIKIVILGGGFGGVRAALDLNKKLGWRKDVEIALIDRKGYQTFHAALYEVASIFGVNHQHPFHTKIRGSVCLSYSDIFRGKRVKVIQAEVTEGDLDKKTLITSGGNEIGFDYLIIAAGSMATTLNVPGVAEYAFKFKTIEDALFLADELESRFARADTNLPIKIIIGGAGFTGIELASELVFSIKHFADKYKIKTKSPAKISILEAGPLILPAISSNDRKKIKRRLNKIGIEVIENAYITQVKNNSVVFEDGRKLESDLTIWTAGIKAPDINSNIIGLEINENKKIIVDNFLRVKNRGTVFGVGDAVIFNDPKNGRSVPQMAGVAIGQGKIVAENIKRLVEGADKKKLSLKQYKTEPVSWVAPVGGKFALARTGEWVFSGLIGYLFRELVFLKYFYSILPLSKAIKIFLSEIRIFSKND